jgi:L-malate glycosyltransferase
MPDPAPLRVCFLVAYFHPFESGAERQALAQGAELVRLGHSVHVLTHAVAGVPTEETIRGIQVHRWIHSSKRGAWFSVSFVASAVRGLRRLRASYDLIHTHQALWEAVAAGVARSGPVRGAPTLVQPASSGYYGEAEELSRIRGSGILRRLMLRNDAFAAISADIERQWRALGVPGERMHRTASGVDGDHFRPARREPHTSEPPRIMFTGRLHPQKNLDVLLEAWPKVSAETGARLVLLGDGPERKRLEEKARTLRIADSVAFEGVVDDVAEALRSAELFVLPSVAEGMSNSLLEAMATGLPCVASDIGGNRDLLQAEDRGPAGLLVSQPTPESWSDALIALIRDPERRATLGTEARRRVDETYDLRRVTARYVALYRKLLGTSLLGAGGHDRQQLDVEQKR